MHCFFPSVQTCTPLENSHFCWNPKWKNAFGRWEKIGVSKKMAPFFRLQPLVFRLCTGRFSRCHPNNACLFRWRLVTSFGSVPKIPGIGAQGFFGAPLTGKDLAKGVIWSKEYSFQKHQEKGIFFEANQLFKGYIPKSTFYFQKIGNIYHLKEVGG